MNFGVSVANRVSRPPAQPALDIGIHIGGSATVILSEHPGAEQAGLKTMPRIFLQQRPGGHIHGEPGVIGLWNFLVRDEQVSGHLPFLDLAVAPSSGDRGKANPKARQKRTMG